MVLAGVGIGGSTVIGSAQEGGSETADRQIYYENFENESYTSAQDFSQLAQTLGYTVLDCPEGCVDFEVVQEEGSSNHVLKFGCYAGKAETALTANPALKCSFGESVSKVVLKYRYKTPETKKGTDQMFLPRLGSSGSNKIIYLLDKYNKLWARENNAGKWGDAIADFKAGEWNDVEIAADLENNLYDVWLNGTCVISQHNTFKNTGSMDFFYIEIYRGTDNVYYFDDIEVLTFTDGESVAFEKASYEVGIGAEVETVLCFTPQDTSFRNVLYTTSDTEVATVDAAGKVAGRKEGSVTITATPAYSGIPAASTQVTVKKIEAEGIVIDHVENDSLVLPTGGHRFLDARVVPEGAGLKIEYESGNEDAVTVDEWGEIVAVAQGTAAITLRAGTYEKTITVTVQEPDTVKTIYVSPNGSAAGDGSLSDKVTIQRAMELVASCSGQMTGNIEVVLDGGYYPQQETIRFTPEHGGKNNYSVIWRAAEGEEPVIGGGIRIAGSAFTKWSENEKIYVYPIGRNVQTRQLYVDQVRAVRARSKGSLTNPEFHADFGYYCENTELAGYGRIEDLELVFYNEWTNSRCGVQKAELTEDGRVKLTMDQPGFDYVTNKASATSTGADTKIAWYENALELLDEPGEWYLDEEAGLLYYMPRPWETMENVTVTVPVVEELVTITGSEDYENMVQNIRFEGITFADTTWMRPSTNVGHAEVQNNHIREYNKTTDRLPDAAVTVKRANSVSFTNCTFTRLGITALKMTHGVQNSPVKDCHFYDISGGAVNIGEPAYSTAAQVDNYYPSDLRKMMKNCDILNNYIHDVAVEYQAAAAVSVAFAANMNLSYNEIFHIPYSGFHIGYGWQTRFANYNKNMVISHNFIHDVMESEVFDGGAIYLLGNTGDGDGSYNMVSDNYIRKQMQPYAPLYADNGCTYWKIQNNAVDLSEVSVWPGETPNRSQVRWGLLNNYLNHLHISDIYTTTSVYNYSADIQFEADDVSVQNIVECDAANWPEQAMEIIRTSGLQADTEADIAARRKGQAERILTDLSAENALKVGDTFAVGVRFTDGKDRTVTGGESLVYYETEDPSVAEISDNGVLSCKKAGITTVRIYVVSNRILDVVEGKLYVGDTLEAVKLKDYEDHISVVAGTTGKQLTPYAVTAMGRNPQITAVRYETADPSVAAVDENGFLRPLAPGETTLTVTITAEGQTISGSFQVTVTQAQTFDGLEVYDAADMFRKENEDTWVKSGVSNWELLDNTRITATVNGYATFGGTRYANEILSFKIRISETGGSWPSLVLRAQDTGYRVSKAGTTGYLFCVKTDGLELHRFNDGVRTCIYGDNESWAPNGGIGGHLITPQPLKRGEEHDVLIGAADTEEGVRIILVVDGVTVIDFTDTEENAIKGGGYFGLVGNSTDTFVLTKIAKDENPTPPSGGDASGGDASGGDASGGDASGGDAPGGDASGGDAPGGDTSGGDASGGNASGGDTSGGDTSGGSGSGGDISGGTSGGEVSGNQPGSGDGSSAAGETGSDSGIKSPQSGDYGKKELLLWLAAFAAAAAGFCGTAVYQYRKREKTEK